MKNTERFTDRVDDYVRHRPGYPTAVLEHLASVGYLFEGARVADLGAGTGIFTTLLLEAGYDVSAVEPNQAMAAPMVAQHRHNEHFHYVAAPAEETTLDAQSIDLVTAAQALHWFDPEPARRELRRITRPPHRLAAIWNRRDVDSSPFMTEYEAMLKTFGLGSGKPDVARIPLDQGVAAFFGHDDFETFTTPNTQRHHWDGLVGRLLSASYGPKPGQPQHEPVMARLRELFDAHAENSAVEMRYVTRVYYGRVL